MILQADNISGLQDTKFAVFYLNFGIEFIWICFYHFRFQGDRMAKAKNKVTAGDVWIGTWIVWLIVEGMLFFVGGPSKILSGRTAYRWDKQTATVLKSTLERIGEKDGGLTVEVEYTVDGVRYRDARRLEDTYAYLQHQQELFFQNGETVDCRFKPSDPTQMVLEQEVVMFDFFVFTTVAVTGLCVLSSIVWPLWLHWRNRDAAVTLSEFAKKAAVALACLFVLLFCGIATVRGVRDAIKSFEMLNWTRAEATIQTCAVTKVRDGQSWDYQLDLSYTYEHDGTTYTSRQWTLLEDDVSAQTKKREAMASLKAGDGVTCYVNPNEPTQAVLQRRLWSHYGLVLLVWLLMYAGCVLYSILNPKTDLRSKTFKLSFEGDPNALEDEDDDDETREDELPDCITELPFELQYTLNRRQRFVPHMGIWKLYWPLVILVLLASPYFMIDYGAWFVLVLIAGAFAIKGFFVGLADVLVHATRPMDLVVDAQRLGILDGRQRRWLDLQEIISMVKIHPHVWTLQFHGGEVIHIPDTVITDRQALHIHLAAVGEYMYDKE